MSFNETIDFNSYFGEKIASKEKKASLDAVLSATKKLKNHALLNEDYIKTTLMSLKPPHLCAELDFKWEYMLSEVLSKLNRDGSDPQVTYEAAITKLYVSEAKCKAVNDNGLNSQGRVPHSYFESIIFGAQKIISDILGPISYDMFKASKFSNGSSTHRKKKQAAPFHKYNTFDPVGVTPGAQKYAEALITLTPLWDVYGGVYNLQRTMGNLVFTVPKNIETDRTACKEPDLNMALQLGVGLLIRENLLRYGVNLNKQSVNQQLALHGSLTGLLSTIDLKAASDSISQRFVMELLPPEWWQLLNALRSPYGTVTNLDGSVVTDVIKWEKHSTMGNGYTFELESLLFYAISRSVTEFDHRFVKDGGLDHSVSVYGDDIIVPTYSSQNTISVLGACGFETNEKKTFTTGPFRESCGKHYFRGYNVNPFYIRKPINSVFRVIWLINALRKWCTDDTGVCDPCIQPLWLKLRREFVPGFLLGGNQVESTSSVASPCQPRYSLVEKRETRRVNGVPGVLQALQLMGQRVSTSHESRMTPFLFKNREEFPDFVKWYDKIEYDSESPSFEFITCSVSKPKLTVIVNEAKVTLFGLWPDESRYDATSFVPKTVKSKGTVRYNNIANKVLDHRLQKDILQSCC